MNHQNKLNRELFVTLSSKTKYKYRQQKCWSLPIHWYEVSPKASKPLHIFYSFLHPTFYWLNWMEIVSVCLLAVKLPPTYTEQQVSPRPYDVSCFVVILKLFQMFHSLGELKFLFSLLKLANEGSVENQIWIEVYRCFLLFGYPYFLVNFSCQ